VLGWAPDYADADNFLYTFYSSNGYYFPRSNWKDASVDKWLDQARVSVDTATRNKLYAQVAQRAYEQTPYMLLPAGINFTIVRDNLKGVSAGTYNPMRSDAYTGVLWKTLSKN
jgi:peptide/nickel transport system substrate-binding protein